MHTLYRHLQYALLGGSVAIVLLYVVLLYGQLLGPGELLGTSPLNLFIAGIHGVYFLLIRRLVSQSSDIVATFIDLLFFSINMAVLLLATGGFSSPYFVFWLAIVLFAAALNRYIVAGYVLVTVIYLGIASLRANAPADFAVDNAIYAVAITVTGVMGLWLWRNHPQEETQPQASQSNELEEKLEIEQLKSDILLKSIGDGALVTDLSGAIQLFNQPAAEITGWAEDEATGIHYTQVIPLEDEEGNELTGNNDLFNYVIRSKQGIRRKDITMLNRQQTRVHLSLTIAPIFASTDSVTGTVAVFSDISQEKKAARERDEFISTASHEMRTPVAAIEGFLSLALNQQVSTVDENAQKYIQKAYESTQHLGKLFKDLLSITRLEDNTLDEQPEPFELGKVIKAAVDELQFKAEQKGLELKLKSHGGIGTDQNEVMPLFYVNADSERIREVFINLVDNAIKFTPEGEVNASISGDDKQVTVGVHDQGIGIPEDEIEHLFQKFYRVDNGKTREIGGTGLGLYLCRTIIEMYNGRIWVESEEGAGSSFYFSLPRLTYSRAQELRAKMESQSAGSGQPAQGGRSQQGQNTSSGTAVATSTTDP
jgi:PAS domain S-box-containing protein